MKSDQSIERYFKDVMEVLGLDPKVILSENKKNAYPQSAILSMIVSMFPDIIFVIDLSTSGYIYISDNILDIMGFDKEELLVGGLQRTMQQFPDAHNEIISQQIFPVMFEQMQKHATAGDYQDIITSYHSQIIHHDGTVRWYSHTIKILTLDANGRPRHLLKILRDITEEKKDNKMTFSIQKKNKNGASELVFHKTFFPGLSDIKLSHRECEILNLISTGLTNQEIADRLFITLNTVQTHRKNILKKTNCKGTAELTKLVLIKV